MTRSSTAPDPEFLALAAQWRDQLKDVTDEQFVRWMEALMTSHCPEKFDALVDSGLVVAGEPVWQFLLSAAEFILITNRETQRGVRP
jgi:hypothetical protein